MAQNHNSNDNNNSPVNKGGRPAAYISAPIIKELLLDISERGGLNLLNLDKLCKSKPDTYGDKANFSLLNAIRNKVSDYKQRPDYYEREQLRLIGEILDTYTPPSKSATPQKSATPNKRNTPKRVTTPPRTTTPPKKQATSRTKEDSLALAFDKLSIMAEHFATMSFDHTVNVDLSHAWNHRELFVTKTPAVTVQADPNDQAISTHVFTIMKMGVDSRFITDVPDDSFEPFKAQQISHNEVVVQIPTASFDLLFGDDSGSKAFKYSDNQQEQDEYMIMKNKLRKLGKNSFTEKICLRFPKHIRLDYQLIDRSKRKGDIEIDLAGRGASLSVKWRIAVVPEEEDGRILRAAASNPNGLRNKFRLHLGNLEDDEY